jgi:hypothetical protein
MIARIKAAPRRLLSQMDFKNRRVAKARRAGFFAPADARAAPVRAVNQQSRTKVALTRRPSVDLIVVIRPATAVFGLIAGYEKGSGRGVPGRDRNQTFDGRTNMAEFMSRNEGAGRVSRRRALKLGAGAARL